MFSNILIYFVVIPLVMMLGLALCRNIKQIRAVAVTGSVALTALSVWLLVDYLALRAAGATEPMLWVDFVAVVRTAQHQPCGGCRRHFDRHAYPDRYYPYNR